MSFNVQQFPASSSSCSSHFSGLELFCYYLSISLLSVAAADAACLAFTNAINLLLFAPQA